MQESKYYYEGIPLTDYCKEHELNVSSVRTRIWKKRNNPKYDKYTDQEIVDMVVKSCGTGIKYMYGDITLRQYCIEYGIQSGTIMSRISAIKKKNPNLPNDVLVRLAVDDYENGNYSLFYEGIPLKDYCVLHPEINYNTIRTYISREKEKDSTKTTEELVLQYLSKERFGRWKYYYCGIPLVKYCEENNISIEAIKGRIYRYKLKNPDVSDDELVQAVMDQYQPFMPKYMYKGVTLSQYCKDNDLSYYSVVSYVKRRLTTDNSLNVDTLIDEGIRTINRYGIVYYYDGIPLKDYAIIHGMNASSIRSSILRKKMKSNKSMQEIVDECVLTYEEFCIKYFYKGETLLSFCKRTGLNYNTVISKYLDLYQDREDISIDEAIELIVDEMIEHPRAKTKYYYGEDSLAAFCHKNGYSYYAVYQRLKTLERKYIYSSETEAVSDAILEYKIKKEQEIFSFLSEATEIDEEMLESICIFLKVDILNVKDLCDMGFSFRQAILMIYSLFDVIDENQNKFLSDKTLSSLFLLLESFENKKDDDSIVISEEAFIVLYRCKLLDTREYVLEVFRDYIYDVIYNVCNLDIEVLSYDIIASYVREVSLIILTALDKVKMGTAKEMLKELKLTVRNMFVEYIKTKDDEEYKLVKDN